MTTKFTPGPWAVAKAKHGVDMSHHIVALVAPDRDDRALVVHAHQGDDTQADANARLIAAAPELLAALEALLDMDVAYQRGPRVQEAVAVARSAIAKAKEERPRHNVGLPRAASWPMSPAEYLARRLREDDEDLQDLMDRDMGG